MLDYLVRRINGDEVEVVKEARAARKHSAPGRGKVRSRAARWSITPSDEYGRPRGRRGRRDFVILQGAARDAADETLSCGKRVRRFAACKDGLIQKEAVIANLHQRQRILRRGGGRVLKPADVCTRGGQHIRHSLLLRVRIQGGIQRCKSFRPTA